MFLLFLHEIIALHEGSLNLLVRIRELQDQADSVPQHANSRMSFVTGREVVVCSKLIRCNQSTSYVPQMAY